jgi:hypothetical protein
MNDSLTFYNKWAKYALLNFVVLAAVGVLLRYKIMFSLPWVDQKHLLHGHSHFAFAGWVGLTLYLAIIFLIKPQPPLLKKLEWLLIAQQVSSYGMLFTFPFKGYAASSITFSTLSIFISYVFAWLVIKELLQRKQSNHENKWLITGLICNIVSSFGTFVLAYLMISKNLHQDWYFGSVYFFLHFQYNGFFLFTIGAMAVQYLTLYMNKAEVISSNRFYNFLVIALVPSFFLSLMWMRIPEWMYYTAVAGALLQIAALVFMSKLFPLLRNIFHKHLRPIIKWFWLFAASAFVIKIILQAFSAIPQLNTYAFGVRPIVIGFLHLVLLAFVSVFLIGYLLQQQMLQLTTPVSKIAAWLFLSSVLLNEVLLMLQGLMAMFYETIPYMNFYLFGTAVLLFLSLIGLLLTNNKRVRERLV